MADTIDEMNGTLDDILSLARLGRPSEPLTEVDLAALVDAVVEDFRDLGKPVEFDEAARLKMRLRPSLMRRAVRNLIENAVKYGGGAEVRLRARRADGRDRSARSRPRHPARADWSRYSMRSPGSKARATGRPAGSASASRWPARSCATRAAISR